MTDEEVGQFVSGARMRTIVVNAHRLIGKKYKSSPLWGLVSDLTGHGSTMSANLCTSVNLKPCQPCSVKELERINDV